VRMINELCYKFMEKIPSPATMSSIAGRPVIREVLTNAIDGPFGPKRVIKVGLQGDPGLVATYDLGSFRKGLPMKELQAGIYAGEYAVLPGDTTRDMPITLSLTRPGGYETQWVDVSGFITIDTTPPPQVTGLRAKGYADRVELTWNVLKNVPDLKGYRVQRSETPLSGFTELAMVEVAAYTDKTAAAGRTYYYRIVSEDQTGNRADAEDGIRAALVGSEPRKLAGTLPGDMTLDGSTLVTATIIVPKGVSLTISSEGRLLFAADAGLQVLGKLMVQGGESPVEFAPSGEGKWSGIVIDGGVANLKRFTVRGATTGISTRESEIVLENGLVSGCTTGIAVNGMTPAELKGLTVSGNTTGLKMTTSSARVTGSSFLQNSEGILLDGFSGEINDNNLLDNERNIISAKPLAVGLNWFGTDRADGLKLVNVTAAKVYNARVPGGTAIVPVVDPYAALTLEERQRKSVELLIEAGGYFRKRNFGKAALLFSENLQVLPTAETYFYLGLCQQEMKDLEKALLFLREGSTKFPQDALLWRSLGMLAYEKGDEVEARKALAEALRLSPDDSQARFVFDRLKK
jgi:tetratricopeptide (TPR) repeat protein